MSQCCLYTTSHTPPHLHSPHTNPHTCMHTLHTFPSFTQVNLHTCPLACPMHAPTHAPDPPFTLILHPHICTCLHLSCTSTPFYDPPTPSPFPDMPTTHTEITLTFVNFCLHSK